MAPRIVAIMLDPKSVLDTPIPTVCPNDIQRVWALQSQHPPTPNSTVGFSIETLSSKRPHHFLYLLDYKASIQVTFSLPSLFESHKAQAPQFSHTTPWVVS